MASRPALLVTSLIIALGISAFHLGCSKSSAGEPATAVLGPIDLNADGSIKDSGIQKIDEQAVTGKNLHVRVVRAALSDLGLNQLAKYKQLRRIDAFGSHVTAAGINKLKKTIPEVEVAG